MELIFRDCKFFIELDNLPSEEIFQPLQLVIGKCGGLIVPSLEACSHAVLWHQQQPEYQLITIAGKLAVSPIWVYGCVEAKRVLPHSARVYQPFPEKGIPGAESKLGCISSFIAPTRYAALTLLACMGVGVTKSLTPGVNTHLIARSVHETSAKVVAARQTGMHVLNLGWPLDCLQQWKLLPEGDYTEDAPAVSLVILEGLKVEDSCVPDSSDDEQLPATDSAGIAAGAAASAFAHQNRSAPIAQQPEMQAGSSFETDNKSKSETVSAAHAAKVALTHPADDVQRQEKGPQHSRLSVGGGAVPPVGDRGGSNGQPSAGAISRLDNSGRSWGMPSTSFSRDFNEPSQAMAAVGRFAHEMDASLGTGDPPSAPMQQQPPPGAPFKGPAAGSAPKHSAVAPQGGRSRGGEAHAGPAPMQASPLLQERNPTEGAPGDGTDAADATPPCSPPRVAATVIMDEEPLEGAAGQGRRQHDDNATSPPKDPPLQGAPQHLEQKVEPCGEGSPGVEELGRQVHTGQGAPAARCLEGTGAQGHWWDGSILQTSGPGEGPLGGSHAVPLAAQVPTGAGSAQRSPLLVEVLPEAAPIAGPVAQLHVRTRAASRSRSATPDTGGSGSGRRSRRKTAAPERAMFSQYLPEGDEKELRAIAMAEHKEQRQQAQQGRADGGRASSRGRGRGRGRGRKGGAEEGGSRAGTPTLGHGGAGQDAGAGCNEGYGVQDAAEADHQRQAAVKKAGVQVLEKEGSSLRAGPVVQGVQRTQVLGQGEGEGQAGRALASSQGAEPEDGHAMDVPEQLPLFVREASPTASFSVSEDDSGEEGSDSGGDPAPLPFMSCREELPQEAPPPSPFRPLCPMAEPQAHLTANGDAGEGQMLEDAGAGLPSMPEDRVAGLEATVPGSRHAPQGAIKQRRSTRSVVDHQQQPIEDKHGPDADAHLLPASDAHAAGGALQQGQGQEWVPTRSRSRLSDGSGAAAGVHRKGSKVGVPALPPPGSSTRRGRQTAGASGRSSLAGEPAVPPETQPGRFGQQVVAHEDHAAEGDGAGAAVSRTSSLARQQTVRGRGQAGEAGAGGREMPSAGRVTSQQQESEEKRPASKAQRSRRTGVGATKASAASRKGRNPDDTGKGGEQTPSTSKNPRGSRKPAAGGRVSGPKRFRKETSGQLAVEQGDMVEAGQPSAKRQRKGSKPSEAIHQGTPPKEEQGLCFALSGFRSHEQHKLQRHLHKLKVPCIIGKESHSWDPSVTHVVAPDMKRTQKCLAGLAAGVWIVGKQYVLDSAKAGQLLPPDEYELFEGVVGLVETGVAKHWRQRRECVNRRAFEGLTILLYQVDPPATSEDITAIIEAGNGKVISRKPGKKQTVDIVVASSSSNGSDQALQAIIDKGALCVSSNYIIEWLAKPLERLTHNVLLGSRDGLAGGKVWVAERERGSTTGEEVELLAPPSPSY